MSLEQNQTAKALAKGLQKVKLHEQTLTTKAQAAKNQATKAQVELTNQKCSSPSWKTKALDLKEKTSTVEVQAPKTSATTQVDYKQPQICRKAGVRGTFGHADEVVDFARGMFYITVVYWLACRFTRNFLQHQNKILVFNSLLWYHIWNHAHNSKNSENFVSKVNTQLKTRQQFTYFNFGQHLLLCIVFHQVHERPSKSALPYDSPQLTSAVAAVLLPVTREQP